MLFKQREVPLNPFGIPRRDSAYRQRLRGVLHRRIKIAHFGVRCGKNVNRVLILPMQKFACVHRVFDRLFAVTKRWIGTGRLEPRAVLQGPGIRIAARAKSNTVINFLKRFGVS